MVTVGSPGADERAQSLSGAELEVHTESGRSGPATDEPGDPLMCHVCDSKADHQAELGTDDSDELPFGDFIMLCGTCLGLLAAGDFENLRARWQFDEADAREFFEHVRQRTVVVWGITAPHERSQLASVRDWLERSK